MEFPRLKRRDRSVGAVSPTISAIILTATVVVLLSVALSYVNSYLRVRVAEDDFNSAKQFMQTIGLQIDDVAWIMGRVETVRYSSRYGEVSILPSALNYTVYVKTEGSGDYEPLASKTVGVLLFNVPASEYSLFNGYYEPIFPSSDSDSALILTGTSAPVVRVFAVEKLPMGDGSFTRIVVAPSIRSLNSTVTTTCSTFYVKLYLPVLTLGSAPRTAESVTVTGSSITTKTKDRVTSVKVEVSFPKEGLGFDDSFFQFPSNIQTINVPLEEYDDAVLEFHASEVTVDLGAH